MKDIVKGYADKLEETAAHSLPYIRNASIMRKLKQAILDYEKAKKIQEKEDGKANRVERTEEKDKKLY